MTAKQRPLRLGLLIDSFQQPAWVEEMLRPLVAADFCRVELIVLNGASSPMGATRRSWRERCRYGLYSCYTKADTKLFRRTRDAFAPRDTSGLLKGCPVLKVVPVQKRFSDYFTDEDVDKILGFNLDVAVRLDFRILRGRALAIARHGVWSLHHGDSLTRRGGPAGFWEVMEACPTTGSVLQVLSEHLDNGQILYRSWAATDATSVHRNKNNFYWKTAAFLGRKLQELHRTGAVAFDHSEPAYAPYSERLFRAPPNREFWWPFLSLLGRASRRTLRRAWFREQWFLAYHLKSGPRDDDRALFRYQPIYPPSDRLWADPFPVEVEGKYHIFVEELIYGGRGHIAVLSRDENGSWSQPQPVLAREYHLSYPFVFFWQGEFYMVPETRENRSVELYRCTRFPDRWEPHAVLMSEINAADATLWEFDGRWWMFLSIAPEGALCTDELFLFFADSPLGPWSPHPCNPVRSDVRCARPAGRIFTQGGRIYRPAQNCSGGYGQAIAVQEILELSRTVYREEQVAQIVPRWAPGLYGTHTLNSAGNLTVVDALRWRRRWL